MNRRYRALNRNHSSKFAPKARFGVRISLGACPCPLQSNRRQGRKEFIWRQREDVQEEVAHFPRLGVGRTFIRRPVDRLRCGHGQTDPFIYYVVLLPVGRAHALGHWVCFAPSNSFQHLDARGSITSRHRHPTYDSATLDRGVDQVGR